MRFAVLIVAVTAITGVIAAPAPIEARDAPIKTVYASLLAPDGEISPCSDGAPAITACVEIDYASGLVNLVINDNKVKGDWTEGFGICKRGGFINWNGGPNWFNCRKSYAAWIHNDISAEAGRKIRDGAPPTLGYYRVSDNTNYRLVFPAVTPHGQPGLRLSYDANGNITRMFGYGDWCV